ncbi:MAG: hypothetical protein F4Z39_02460 [Chloroflexi bacterium]|nr:hypothetical protein [Chloroflexota bacterium]
MRRHVSLAFALFISLMLAGELQLTAQVSYAAYLEVIDAQPSPASQLGLREAVTLSFNRRVDCAAAKAAFSMQPAAGGQLRCDEYSLSFQPDGSYQRGQQYTFSLHAPLAAKDGAPLLDAFHVDFSTVGFLAIAESFPMPDSSLAPVDSAITVAFDAPVVPLVLSPARDDLPQPLSLSPAVAGNGEWVNSAVYVYTPSEPLAGDTQYNVRVAADLAAVDGAVMAGAASWTFTTASPAIVAIDPPPGTDDLILNPRIQVRFDQPLSPNRVERAFRFQALPKSDGPNLGGAFEWAEDGLGFAYIPERRLALDTVYQASFDGELLPSLHIAGAAQAPGWSYTTVGPPRIIATEPRAGERDASAYGLSLYFASPMDIDSLDGKVRIEPAPSEEPTTYYSDWNNRYALAFDAQPDTDYRVTVAAGMKDIYGNAITQPLTFAYRTEPRPPEVGFVNHNAVAFSGAQPPTQLQFYQRGVEHVDLALYAVSLDDFIARLTDPERYSPAEGFAPPESGWLQSWRIPGAEGNTRQTETVTLAQGGLAAGIYYVELNAPGLDTRWAPTRHFLAVADALLTMKQSATKLTIWALDAVSGAPIRGERITVFGPDSSEIGSGISDEQGIAQIDLPPDKGRYAGYAAVLETSEHFGIGYSNWTDGVEPWEFGIDADFYPSDHQVYVYTDRPVYRPGQPVYFRGLARAKADVSYPPPALSRILVTFGDSRGDVVYEQELPLSEYGSFHGEFTLSPDAAPGHYFVSSALLAEGGIHEANGWSSFLVAEYRLPEFQVSLSAEPSQILPGATAEIALEGKYFFGGVVSGANADYVVLSAPYAFEYSGAGNYDFGERDLYDAAGREFYIDESLIAQGELRADAAVKARFKLVGELPAEEASQRWRIEASIGDESGQAIYEQTSLIVHQGLFYIGARPENAVVRAGEDSRIQLIAVDWGSQSIADQPLDIEVVEIRWRAEQEQDPISGRVDTTWTVEEIPVSSGRLVTDEKGKAAFDYQPPAGGVYKITATASDSAGNEIRTSTSHWVAGEEPIAWRAQNDRHIDIVPAQSDYRVGETAQVLITSPFQGEARALLTIERGEVLHSEVLTLHSNSQLYEFDILPEHAPSIYVSAFITQPDADNRSLNWRMGMTQLAVDTERKALDIDIRPDRQNAAPGDTINWRVQVSDYRGAPVEAEVGLALTDLAALSLGEPVNPSLLERFYGRQPLGLRTSSPLAVQAAETRMAMEAMAADMGMGGGRGGGLADEAVFDIRSEFIDTPYWHPRLETDSAGLASFSTRLPDNLTTWRLAARAWTKSPGGQLLLGEETADLRSARPLLIRPITPRFFVVGDRAQLAAIVNNNSQAQVSATVSLRNLAGLELVDGELQQRRISIPAGGRQRVTWQVEVSAVEMVAPYFAVRSDDGLFSDASISPVSIDDEGSLPVYRFAAAETVGTAGQLGEAGTRQEALRLPNDLDLRAGSLEIRLQTSLAGALTESLAFLEAETTRHWDCAASLVSRFLPHIVSYRALQQLDLADAARKADLDALTAATLLELTERQLHDGGWSWCGGEHSDITTTAYALYGLSIAQLEGYRVDSVAISNAQNYLQRALIHPSLVDEPWQLNRQAFMLFALAMSGAPDYEHSAELFESRQRLNLDAVAFLAQTLHSLSPQDATRLDALVEMLLNRAVIRATGTFFEESYADRWNWSSDLRSTALALDSLLLLRPESELLPNIVRYLVAARESKGHWRSLQQTTWTILALTNWLLHSGELAPDFMYSAALNEEQLLANAALPDNALQDDLLQVGLDQLLPGETSLLAFQRGAGAGALYYTARLQADLPLPALQPVSRGLEISRTYTRLGDETRTPLDSAAVGEILQARLRIVAPNTLRYVVIEDFFPAGVEAINPALATSRQAGTSPGGERIDGAEGWGWWRFDAIEFHDEKASIYASYLPRGVYEYVYTIRPSFAGEYQVIPPTAHEMNFPEVYARGAGRLFRITEG